MPRVTQWILSTSVASLSRTSSSTSDDRTGSRSSFSFQHYLRRRKELVSDSMLKLKEGGGMAGLINGRVGWARPCDSCQSAACLVYCQTDTAYLCASCDGRVHAANDVAFYHERVWVCEACEREPAVISCKADAAVLCADCDADIHSANPLALRHHRVPALPVSPEEVAAGRRARVVPPLIDRSDGENVDEEASWSLPDPIANGTQDGNGFVYDGEIDEYLDLGEYNSCGDLQNQEKEEGRDGIVPGGSGLNQQQQQHGNFHPKMESDAPKAEFCYTTDSIGHRASHLSSVLVSEVSDATSVVGRGTTQQLSVLPYQTEVPMDREARVQRYKEKKKMRKFEKTIRYASRKAYAEVRPRIKGRFAKRSDVEVEQLFSVDRSRGYGVVPTL